MHRANPHFHPPCRNPTDPGHSLPAWTSQPPRPQPAASYPLVRRVGARAAAAPPWPRWGPPRSSSSCGSSRPQLGADTSTKMAAAAGPPARLGWAGVGAGALPAAGPACVAPAGGEALVDGAERLLLCPCPTFFARRFPVSYSQGLTLAMMRMMNGGRSPTEGCPPLAPAPGPRGGGTPAPTRGSSTLTGLLLPSV